ncbi:hypothetical protein ACTHO0_24965 [Cytobacillus praedii]|uniref:hypothetical protein n=1 Tax=Cytobacillus praedii TaxID=1742358 RepID=UPI003F821AC0
MNALIVPLNIGFSCWIGATRYIHVSLYFPETSGEFIIKELLKISEDVVAIQVEFDQYLNGYNMEFEI